MKVEGDSDDSSDDDNRGALEASYHVGAVRSKQVLGYSRRASTLVDLLAQWKDGA